MKPTLKNGPEVFSSAWLFILQFMTKPWSVMFCVFKGLNQWKLYPVNLEADSWPTFYIYVVSCLSLEGYSTEAFRSNQTAHK